MALMVVEVRSFGEQLRSARLDAGYTRLEFRRRAGISANTLQRLETKPGSVPTDEVVIKIAAALELPASVVRGWSGPRVRRSQ